MEDDEFDSDFRRRVYDRALEEQNNNLWNFKRYYTAASFWAWIDVGTSLIMAAMGAVLTYGLAWRELPLKIMVSFSLITGTIALAKANRKPGQRSEKLHSVGRRYQRLHDKIQDFIKLDLKDSTREREQLRERFEELAEERHNLKEEAKLSGFWYWWVKRRRGDRVYDEAATTPEERERLDPEGFD